MSANCRIRRDFTRPDQALVDAFKGLPVANIDDCMGRLACLNADIRPINDSPLLGVAFTVKAPAGDNLMFHKALDLAKPGDILVIATGGSLSRSLCGEIMTTYAKSRGIRGFIVDGCIRDSEELSQMHDFPIYYKGITPNGPYKNGPGEINFPVSVAGQVICPGDILVGDQDSVIVIKPEEAAALAKAAWAVNAKEDQQKADIRSGKGFPRPFVDKTLDAIGVEYVD